MLRTTCTALEDLAAFTEPEPQTRLVFTADPEFWPVLTAEGEAAPVDVEWAAHSGARPYIGADPVFPGGP